MSNKRILHDNGQGGLAIVIPAPQYVQAMLKANPGMTEAQVIEHIAQKDTPNGAAFEVVDVTDVPADRTFRDAWEHDTSPAPQKVRTNMVKAGEIAHGIRRERRAEAFKPHDEAVTLVAGIAASGAVPPKAMKDAAVAAEAARQAIRDADAATQAEIDAAVLADDEAALRTALGL